MLTGDSFFHLAAFGEALPGLNMCGAGRVVCLIDPVGDVYACPFAIHENFLAGNVRSPRRVRRRSGGTPRCSPSCAGRRRAAPARSCQFYDSCRGGCMAAKFFTGLPLDGPDPECVRGFGEQALAGTGRTALPRPGRLDHSHRGPVRGQARSRAGPPAGPGDDRAPPGARAAGPGVRRQSAGRLRGGWRTLT